MRIIKRLLLCILYSRILPTSTCFCKKIVEPFVKPFLNICIYKFYFNIYAYHPVIYNLEIFTSLLHKSTPIFTKIKIGAP